MDSIGQVKAKKGGIEALELTLARNVDALMKRTPSLNSALKLNAACNIGTATIWRIVNAQGSTRLDAINKLAHAFGVLPWELLRPTSRDKPLNAVNGLSGKAMDIGKAFDELGTADQEVIHQIVFMRLGVKNARKPKPGKPKK